MWSWLSQISPNTVVGLVVLVGGWVWSTVRGDQRASIGDSLKGLATQALHTAMDDPALSQSNVEAMATSALWAAAGKAGIPRNAATEALATPIIHQLVGDLMGELRTKNLAEATARVVIAKPLAPAPIGAAPP
jgi:hypothetical protein